MTNSPAYAKLLEEARQQTDYISVQDLKAKIDADEDFYLVDVRNEQDWSEGHLPRAIHLPRGTIERDIEQRIPSFDAEIVLYCSTLFASLLVTVNIHKMGYSNIKALHGGWDKWTELDYPTVNDKELALAG